MGLLFDIVPQKWAKSQPAHGLVNRRYVASAAGFREGGSQRETKVGPPYLLTFFADYEQKSEPGGRGW